MVLHGMNGVVQVRFPAGLSAQIDDPRHDPRTRHGFNGTTWDGKKWSLALSAKSGLEFEAW